MKHEDMTYNLNDFLDWEEGLLMRTYTTDFETTTDPNDCRVWAYGICDVNDIDFVLYGNSIEGFINWLEAAANCHVYFHNLGFDGAFLFDWLERNQWRWVEDATKATDFTYTTLISDMNMVYCITLYFSKYRKVKIYDSFKIIPLSIRNIAKAYNLPIKKGSIDYDEYREPGHELTDEEKEYIKNDVQIAAMALKHFIDEGLTKMTAGSNALYDFKKRMGGYNQFRKIYPEIDEEQDAFIRKAYRGGFTYCDPRHAGEIVGDGIVFDVNSLYPSVMHDCVLPYGNPVWFDGEYEEDWARPLWIAAITFRFDIKPDHIPCIQIKGNVRFKQTEYLESSGTEVTLCLTNVDWQLIQEQYTVKTAHWLGGYKFKGNEYQFKEYVENWTAVKNAATVNHNLGKRNIAKLMLNSLYGKFATRIQVQGRKPKLVDDAIKYVDLEPETRKPVYLPVGVFVTSYARAKTVKAAQSVYDRFLYADTDSLHLLGTDIPECLEVDPVELGKWKHESTFTRAKYLRAKCYCEEIDGNLVTHVAGMPSNVHSQVTLDNFEIGAEYQGKLYQKRVSGGIVLEPGSMTIREN